MHSLSNRSHTHKNNLTGRQANYFCRIQGFFFIGYEEGGSYIKIDIYFLSTGFKSKSYSNTPLKYADVTQDLIFISMFDSTTRIFSQLSDTSFQLDQYITMLDGSNTITLGSPTSIKNTNFVVFGRESALSTSVDELNFDYMWEDSGWNYGTTKFPSVYSTLKYQTHFKYDITVKGVYVPFAIPDSPGLTYQSSSHTSDGNSIFVVGQEFIQLFSLADLSSVIGKSYSVNFVTRTYSVKISYDDTLIAFGTDSIGIKIVNNDATLSDSWGFETESDFVYSICILRDSFITSVSYSASMVISFIDIKQKSYIAKYNLVAATTRIYQINSSKGHEFLIPDYIDSKGLVFGSPVSCNAECGTCDSLDPSICYSCGSANPYTENGTCVSACTAGYYLQDSECLQCSAGCISCDLPNVCLACDTGSVLYKYLKNGVCVETCGAGYYINSDSCIACSTGCLSCSSASQCTTCDGSGSLPYLMSGVCVAECEDGYFLSGSECLACSPGCITCSDAQTCTQCSSTDPLYKYLDEGTCLQTCPLKKYASLNQCLNCSEGCITCSSAEVCLECTTLDPQHRYLKSNVCIADCGEGFIIIDNECVEDIQEATTNNTATNSKEVEPDEYIDFLFIQTPMLENDEDYDVALKLNLFKESEVIFNSSNLLQDELNNFEIRYLGLKLNHTLIFRQDEELYVKISFLNYPEIYGSIIELEVTPISLALIEKNLTIQYLVSTSKYIKVALPMYSSLEISRAKEAADISGSIAKTTITTLEFVFLALNLVSVDPSAELIKVAMYCKLISILSFINLKYGSRLGVFYLASSMRFTKSTESDQNSVVLNENGWKGRISQSFSSFDIYTKFGYKVYAYGISWVFMILSWYITRFVKIRKEAYPVLSFIVFYFRRLHLCISSIFMTDGVFIVTRILLHQRNKLDLNYISSIVLLLGMITDFKLLFKKQ